MKRIVWIVCILIQLLCVFAASIGAAKGLREGRKANLIARLKSPTIFLFSAYLLVASLVLPVSPGETASPLLGLSMAIPLLYALASLAALGSNPSVLGQRISLALLFFGSALSAGLILLALFSPAFVPAWLR